MDELPEPWRTAAERAGVRQSLRGLAEEAGVGHPTVKRLITGDRTSPKTVMAVAGALRVDEGTVRSWANIEPPVGEPWAPPEASRLLSPRARAALTELILAITDEREGGSSASTDVPPKKSGGGGEPRSLSDYKRRRLDDAAQLQQDAADHPDDDPR